MKTAIVILNYNDGARTAALAEKISGYSVPDHIILVDNCSTDDSFSVLGALANERITVLQAASNAGYARGNNLGIRHAIDILGCDYIFTANPDVFFTEKTAAEMLEAMQLHKEYGVIAPLVKSGCNIWNLPGFGGIIESLFLVWFTLDKKNIRKKLLASPSSLNNAGVAEGSFFLISAAAFRDTGGFDERTFLYGEEIILAKRLLQHGYREGVLTDCFYDHLHSASIRKRYHSSKARAFHHFRDSFRIYNKYYLHTSPPQDIIFDIAYFLGYVERLIYDLLH